MEVIFIIGIVLIAFGVYLFLKDFTYMLQWVILMILGAGILGISLSYIVWCLTAFWHKNIIKFDGRPFESAEEMDAKIIENWNNVVKNNDNVYIVGDMFWCKMDIYGEEICFIILMKWNHSSEEEI